MLLSTYWIINLGILFAIRWRISSNWLILWGIIEFNSFIYVFLLLIIAPLLAPAYFIPQTIAALIFVFYLLPWPSSWLILTVFIILKLPLMPLHMWFVSLTLTLPLLPLLILHSFQKLIPLLFIILYKIGPLTFRLRLIRMLTAGVTGLIAPNPLWLLAFSSILNNTWLISLSFSSPLLISVGYFFYTAIVSTIILSRFNISFKFLPMSWQLFSLVGVPPLPGFFLKFLPLITLSLLITGVIRGIIVTFTLLPIIFYTKILSSTEILVLNSSLHYFPFLSLAIISFTFI